MTPQIAIWIMGVILLCMGAIGFAAYFRSTPEKSTEPLIGDMASMQKSEVTGENQKTPLADTNKGPCAWPDSSRNRKTNATATRPEALSAVSKTITKPGLSEKKDKKAEVKTEKRQIGEVKKTQKEKKVADQTAQKPVAHIATKPQGKPGLSDVLPEKAVTQKEKPIPMDRLEGVDFKIQAISWGETHRERLVVISNEVLREGDGIKGYQISRINPDDVILHRDGKDYRLDFRSAGQP